MIQLPLNSSVDLETEDIIQSDNIQFKRKNSLVYKGLLSSMTKGGGDGFLSTTGKNITVSGNVITANGTEYTITPEAYVTESGTEKTSDDIIFARKTDDHLFILHKVDSNTVVLEVDGETLTVNDTDTVDMNGTVTTDGRFIVALYYEDTTKVNVYSSSLALSTTHDFEILLGSKAVTSYVSGISLYIGFDSEDLRKRYVFRRQKVIVENWSKVVEGMGCVSETGLVTGEPFFWTVTSEYTSTDQPIANSANLETYIDDSYTSISYLDNNSYFYYTVLNNGVIQTERFNVLFSSPHYKTLDSVGGSDVDPTFNITDKTGSHSWFDGIKSLGANPIEEYQSGSQSDNNIQTGIMNYSPGSWTGDGSDTVNTIHLYVMAIQINADISLSPYVLPAMRRSDVSAWSFSGGSYTRTIYEREYKAGESVTEISFFDYDNPLGRVGIDEISNGEQVFPHMRFFQNNTNYKGKYWDYGKGWVKATYDTIHFRNYSSYGTAIYEEPLKLVTVTKDGMTIDEIDIQNNETDYSYYPSLDKYTWNTSYYVNSDKAVMDETRWYDTGSHSSTGNGIIRWTTASGRGFDVVRLHPVRDEQIASSTWYFNHSFRDTLQSIPFSVPLSDNITTQIYAGIKTSLAYNKTLLFTPHTMEDNYSFNDGYVVTWSSGTITWAKIEEEGEIELTKMTDYIFKTNVIGKSNVLVEDRQGNFTVQRAFIPYIMDSVWKPFVGIDYLMPSDASSYTANDVYYYGFGYNSGLREEKVASSFLLPAVTLPSYVNTSILTSFNRKVLNDKKGILRADIERYFYDNELVEEYWTHSQATTDILYKNSRYLVSGVVNDTLDADYTETSWWPDTTSIIYPIGLLSTIYGENYISSTVDVGNNYTSRFYNKQNKTYLVYNNVDAVYYGSEIFTIQSGNYYFDGQGIYYLGSQSDYSQNVFTAYAVGMKFIANSSSEAYFYSEWDKSLYIYTASNTLQKSISLADMGNIVDSLYSSAEQALYILFDGGRLMVRTQNDMCLIEGVTGSQLQSTYVGCQIIGDGTYEIYNPYLWDDTLNLELETEWLGNSDAVTKYQYVDFVFYSEKPDNYTVTIAVDSLNGNEVKHEDKTVEIQKSDWANKLYRVRFVPKEINGNAIKVYLTDVKGNIRLFALSVQSENASRQTTASRGARY